MILLVVLASFVTIISDAASAVMNKCTHPDGRIEYTDQPCPLKETLQIKKQSNLTSTSVTQPNLVTYRGDATPALHVIGIYEGQTPPGVDDRPWWAKCNDDLKEKQKNSVPAPLPFPSIECHQKYSKITTEKIVIVNVNDINRPVVLALTANNKTLWRVRLAEGVNITKVILAGYHSQRVLGLLPDTPIETYTYDPSPCAQCRVGKIHFNSYEKAPEELKEITGLNVTSFHGDYKGAEFSISSSAKIPNHTVATPETHALAQIYFKPYQEDGSPIRPGNCGSNNNSVGWLNRDLGYGVNIEAGIVYEKGKQITATLFFRNRDGKVDLSPNEFKLYGFPNERMFFPSEVRRSIYKLDSETCADGEWVYLKFPVKPEDVQQIALVFPSDGVVKSGYRIKVRPFRFDKIDDSANGTSKPAMLPISASLASNELTAEERMKSCDPKIAITAADEVVNKTSSLKEPLSLFSPAAVLFQQGKKDDAVFWFYAAQLRTRYQLAVEKSDRGQLLTIMMMTVGAPINNYAFQDVSNLNRILDRVLEWDKKTSNPFMEKPKTEAIDRQIEQIYSGLRDLKTKLAKDKVELETVARKAAPGIEQAYSQKGNQLCQKGKQ